jgi:hypothetical protein
MKHCCRERAYRASGGFVATAVLEGYASLSPRQLGLRPTIAIPRCSFDFEQLRKLREAMRQDAEVVWSLHSHTTRASALPNWDF